MHKAPQTWTTSCCLPNQTEYAMQATHNKILFYQIDINLDDQYTFNIIINFVAVITGL